MPKHDPDDHITYTHAWIKSHVFLLIYVFKSVDFRTIHSCSIIFVFLLYYDIYCIKRIGTAALVINYCSFHNNKTKEHFDFILYHYSALFCCTLVCESCTYKWYNYIT